MGSGRRRSPHFFDGYRIVVFRKNDKDSNSRKIFGHTILKDFPI